MAELKSFYISRNPRNSGTVKTGKQMGEGRLTLDSGIAFLYCFDAVSSRLLTGYVLSMKLIASYI